MRIVIADDEPLARQRLKRLLSEIPGAEIIGEASNGDEVLELIARTEPDIAFLDIRMPGRDGLQVARDINKSKIRPSVIFTTAYPEHALSAFDVAAMGYLLKPIRLEKLKESLQRAFRNKPPKPDIESNEDARKYVLATHRDGVERIPVDEIVYFLADQKYTTVRHLHGEALIDDSLRSLEKDLGDAFLRVHRKVLVASRYILGLDRSHDDEDNNRLVVRHCDRRLPVSRRKLAEVKRYIDLSAL